ncbi:MAG: hypothetical protein QM785_19535 [Pyrinomonadaceae bacterium]
MAQAQNVLDAVSTSRTFTSQGIMQRLFAYWFDAFVYNQIWEDPASTWKPWNLMQIPAC